MIGRFILLSSWFIFIANGENTSIEPCSLSSPKLDECLKKNAQLAMPRIAAGIPELGLEPMDPYTVPDYDGAPNGEINFAYSNVKVHGIKDAVVDSIKLSYKKRKMILKVTYSPKINTDFRYKGSFLATTVHGKGVFNSVNTHNTFKIYFTVINKNGKDHWRVIKHKVSYSPENIVHNLKIEEPALAPLGGWLSNFMNGHYKDIHSEIGAPMSIAMTNKIVDYIDMMLAAVPLDEIVKP